MNKKHVNLSEETHRTAKICAAILGIDLNAFVELSIVEKSTETQNKYLENKNTRPC
jgi:predicted HicB family RNase H-like nuclease